MIKIGEKHLNWECPWEEMNDKMNRPRTKSLFAETIGFTQLSKGILPVYTLSNQDKMWTIPKCSPHYTGERILLPSAYLIYMTASDEFDAAMKLVGSTKNWNALLGAPWFQEGTMSFPGIDSWREDMRLRDLSKAKKALEDAVEDGNVSAAKALYQQSRTKQTAGRPVKEKNKPKDYTEEIDALYDNVIGIDSKGGRRGS